MIIGNILLLGAIAATLALSILNYFKPIRREWIYAAPVTILAAYTLLFDLLLSGKFGIYYVYAHTSLETPLYLKIAALWSGESGSLLLWAFIISIIAVIINRKNNNREAVSILLMINFFLLLSVFMNSPFQYSWNFDPEKFSSQKPPVNGIGVNPLLDNIFMLVHPPLLFLGYSGAALIFAITAAGLIKKNYYAISETLTPALLFTIISLGAGLISGGIWSYEVLGWGGYWGWDPVENLSLIPWLLTAGLIHSIILQKKNSQLTTTNHLLGLAIFITTLIATVLTRSSVLENVSVHSFGTTQINVALITLLVLSLLPLSIIIIRKKTMNGVKLDNQAFSHNGLIFLSMLVFLLLSIMIFLGTVLPVILRHIFQINISINTEFFPVIVMPLAVTGIALLTVSSIKSVFTIKLLYRKILLVLFPVILSAMLSWFILKSIAFKPFAFLLIFLSLFLIFINVFLLFKNLYKNKFASILLHTGIAITAIGIIASSSVTETRSITLVEEIESYINDDMAVTYNGSIDSERIKLSFKNDKSSFIKTPFLYYNADRKQIVRTPVILHQLFADYYIEPVQIESGRDRIGRKTLSINQTIETDNMKYNLVSVKSDDSGNTIATIDIKSASFNKRIKLLLSSDGHATKEASFIIPQSENLLILLGANIEQQKIELFIEPESDEIALDALTVQIKKIPFIGLIPLGLIVVICGFISFGYQRRLQKMIRPD